MTIKQFFKSNQSGLLVAGASVGVIATAYLAAQGGYRSVRVLEQVEHPDMSWREKVHHVWRFYIPAAGAGAATIVCVAGLKHVDGRRILAAQGALEVSRRAFEGYRAQVVDELGGKKDQLFAARAAEQAIQTQPPLIVAGEGQVLCCELYTGRYFISDMQSLTRAVNEINQKTLKHDYATLDDLYYILGLQQTTESGNIGWTPTQLLELEFSSVIYNDKPVLAFGYNYVKTL